MMRIKISSTTINHKNKKIFRKNIKKFIAVKVLLKINFYLKIY